MKQPYEKPTMASETIEIGTLVAGTPSPEQQLEPFFGLCPPCE